MQPDSPLGVGDAAPDFALAVADGEATMLSDLRGGSVLLVLASPHWDPASELLAAHYSSRTDGAAAPRVVMERRPEITSRFGVRGGSALYVVDEHGAIRWRYVAGVDVVPQSSVDGACRSLDSLRSLGMTLAKGSEPSGFALVVRRQPRRTGRREAGSVRAPSSRRTTGLAARRTP